MFDGNMWDIAIGDGLSESPALEIVVNLAVATEDYVEQSKRLRPCFGVKFSLSPAV